MPNTAEIQDRLADSEAKLTAFRRSHESNDLGKLRMFESGIRDCQWKLEQAKERDALQAGRPDGCWCLGIGGRDQRWRGGPHSSFEMWIFDVYCPCLDGQRMQAEHEAIRARIERQRLQDRIALLLAEADIPPRFEKFTFAGYPFSDATKESVDHVKLWAFGAEDDAPEERVSRARAMRSSLLLYGAFGTGKTGIAVAALRGMIRRYRGDGLFTTVPVLLDTIRRGYDRKPRGQEDEEDDSANLLERVKDATYLVLDDLGAERVTDWVAERLFVIVNHRHDHEQVTIFTSNLSPDQLGAHIGERTMWRIIEMAEIVKLDGPNLRDRATPKAAAG